MLKSIVYSQKQVLDKAGKPVLDSRGQPVYENDEPYLNSLRRYCLSALMVPQQNLAVAKCPVASSASQPGLSLQIPIQGPKDGKTEVYSLSGLQGAVMYGIGVLSSVGNTVTGIGTQFSTQVAAGDTIFTGSSAVVASVQSNTSLTTVGALGAGANSVYVIITPVGAAPEDSKLFVKIQDPSYNRSFMNRSVPVKHVFGTKRKPLYLCEAPLLEVDQTLLFQFHNHSLTAPASFAPIAEGRKWQDESLRRPEVAQFIDGLRTRKTLVMPYWLTLDDGVVNLTAGQTNVTKFFTLTGDLTFVIFNVYGNAYSAGAAGNTQELVGIQLYDAKTQRSLFVQDMTLNTVCGTSENPFVLPTPWIVEPQTQIRAVLSNLVTDATTNFWMTFHGVALYTGINQRGGGLNDPAILAEAQRMYKAMSTPQIRPASPRD